MSNSPFIHPTALIDPAAQIGEGVTIGPYSQISAGTILGAGVKLHSHVVIQGNTFVGAETEIFPFACLGAPPQFLNSDYCPQSGLSIGEKTVIREHVTLHPGTPKWGNKTTIGSNCLLMAGSHVGHDCQIGDHVVLTNNVAVGGHCIIGDYVNIGGLSGIRQFVRVGDFAFVGGLTGVESDIIPFGNAQGNRAVLRGLNLIGLKRRGMDPEAINELRFAYRLLFADEGSFSERVEYMAEKYAGNPLIRKIVDFIQRDPSRPICTPQTK